MSGEAPHALCQWGRVEHAMAARGIDALVITSSQNLYYLSGFLGIAHKSDEPRPYCMVWSRHAPDHPILIVADYYYSPAVAQCSWIEDIRPFRAVMMPLDLPAKAADIDNFIPEWLADGRWAGQARDTFSFSQGEALKQALSDLALDGKTVAFDDLGFGLRAGVEPPALRDAYDVMMFARAVKTPAEVEKLAAATALNEQAILRTVAAFDPAMSWADLDRAYAANATALGGFVRDPGGMVWGHPRGSDAALVLSDSADQSPVGAGTHVMFDCHGTLDYYCWDGGKTWVTGGEPEGLAKQLDRATRDVSEAMLAAMKPGAKVSELQAHGRGVYRQAGVPDADRAVIFFHGLGLSHMDIEQTLADGSPNGDWTLEEGMVVPLHLLYPGGQSERLWLEEVAVIGADGARPLFNWGFEALRGA